MSGEQLPWTGLEVAVLVSFCEPLVPVQYAGRRLAAGRASLLVVGRMRAALGAHKVEILWGCGLNRASCARQSDFRATLYPKYAFSCAWAGG